MVHTVPCAVALAAAAADVAACWLPPAAIVPTRLAGLLGNSLGIVPILAAHYDRSEESDAFYSNRTPLSCASTYR